MTLFSAVLLLVVVTTSGCADKKDHLDATGPSITSEPRHDNTVEKLKNAISEGSADVNSRIQTSQNSIQSNMQSLLGVSVGKISDDLLKMEASFSNKVGDIKTNMAASLASNNELRAMLKAQMDVNAKLEADIRATIQVNASLEAKIQAVASAQIGMGNKLENYTSELKQNLSAGHDVNNSTNQFTQEMLQALKSANDTTIQTNYFYMKIFLALISAVTSIVCYFFNASRKRADLRAQEANQVVKHTHDRMSHVLANLPPGLAKALVDIPKDPSK
jgi:hypothetical protein